MKYFILNPSSEDAYGEASRAAMLEYSRIIGVENSELAKELYEWVYMVTPKEELDE